MANATTTEIIMQFVPDGARALEAECQTVIDAGDKLAGAFATEMRLGFKSPRYFLVDTFKFGVQLRDGETEARDKAQQVIADHNSKKKLASTKDLALAQKALDDAHAAGKGNTQSFERWRSNDSNWRKTDSKQTYNAKIDEFSLSRRIDLSSVSMFDYCTRQKTFAWASLVKRKNAVVPLSDIPQTQSYLRLDFKNVVLSSVKWSDDDVVEETCTFHAKEMYVQFWTEGLDRATQTEGVLGPFNSAKWVNQVTTTTK